ncbi:MAG: ABC transporter ATP-binding protein [Sedimentisphaerales bacterium]|nr:ABC transporter ATP-binding protein [Sedimentisphaerales bacterium]
MTEPAIKIEGLHFSYGKKHVLKGVDLEVPKGSIFGFIGRNGTGKTTTIKTMLGLQKPSSGKCIVGGFDSFTQTLEIRKRIGFMAEDQQMYGWMKVGRIIKWVAGFYPDWDYKFSAELAEILRLPMNVKVKALSKGQNSSLALLLALGHRPDIVILDDPTLGLDPIARKDFLRHVIDLLQSNSVTVFFSSHLLYEIEPVADYIAILDNGVIIKAGKTEELREKIRRFILKPKPDADFGRLASVLDILKLADNISLAIEDCDESKKAEIKTMSSNGYQETALNLDEIFEAYVIGNRGDLHRA